MTNYFEFTKQKVMVPGKDDVFDGWQKKIRFVAELKRTLTAFPSPHVSRFQVVGRVQIYTWLCQYELHG